MSGFGHEERPGDRGEPYLDGAVETARGPVPRVVTSLTARDRWGAARARLGFGRDDYKVVPGLYCVGTPDAAAPVLVTCNYKLTFDALRAQLGGVDAWLLVVDTHGINVWCAAGKGRFSAAEVARSVLATQLDRVVEHRRLVLPQLAANGVAAHELGRLCGFSGRFGPLRAEDVPAYLQTGELPPAARRVTFALAERAVLIPVELTLLWKTLLWAAAAWFVLSGVGSGWFSLGAALSRWVSPMVATAAGIAAGAVLVPLLLPWLPGRAFSVKGATAGAGAAGLLAWALAASSTVWELGALALWTVAAASFLSMNFTGATPFTSPTGVEKEMRRALPWQAAGAVASAALWVTAAFV